MSCPPRKIPGPCELDPAITAMRLRFPGFRPEPGCRETVKKYPALVTPYYLSLAREPSMNDPVFRQVAPSAEELGEAGREDPANEAGASPAEGLVHRFEGRALLVVTGSCFVRCRHCMRKRMWRKPGGRDLRSRVREWKSWLAGRPDVREAILSGGDPLTLDDASLARLLDELSEVGSIQKVRVHTRAPVVAPQRVGAALARMLFERGVTRLVTQFNHPCEITPASLRAVRLLKRRGIKVLNQAVLLKGVNDDPAVLSTLFCLLQRNGIENYYLHHPDPVKGAMHFQVSLDRGLAAYEEAVKSLKGISPPRYVLDLPERGKTEVRELIA